MNNTQLKQVLGHLKQGETISQAEAIDLFDCYRLSAIIQRLRNTGYNIATHNERNKSGIGRHARYELVKQVAA
ncbi:helix-turn-helix domain-containing protein [Acinetobacter sp. UBA3106]|uniref:helix-turn-helix domain-containing protein n=1 Tax=Acinetobacter sp. UBA3106 TaxID=1945936 RepID=UPI0025C4B9A8|nr:helix-turn-helix domain-containing protein [Acinetobacter sp. UBA3106]